VSAPTRFLIVRLGSLGDIIHAIPAAAALRAALPGAKIDLHDHTFEESYFIVSGQVRATADGETYELGPGDVVWTGVGCVHSFANIGTEPVRWIETQAPLPPAKEVFRFEKDWTQYAADDAASSQTRIAS